MQAMKASREAWSARCAIVEEVYEGQVIPFQRTDAFVNATAMCKAFGRLPYDFLRLPETRRYQDALAKRLNALRENLVVTVNGGTSPGTWLHPNLAMECARWLSPDFSIWCNETIRRILAGELEAKPSFEIPSTYSGALLLAAEQARRAEIAERQNVELVKAADALVGRAGQAMPRSCYAWDTHGLPF